MTKNELNSLSDSLADAVEKAARSIVLVNARRRMPASGIVLKKDLILTADHVVEVDENIQVILPDGTQVEAALKGRDPGSDLALLQLEGADLTPAETNGEPRVGQLALALGRPSRGGIEASLGIVSAFGGPVRARRGGVLEKTIRTDAVPFPGFSGGPLVNTRGEVIGLNTSGFGHGSSITIPIDLAQKIAASIEEHGSMKRGCLGVRTQDVPLPDKAELDRQQAYGLLILGIEENSPAAEAGLMTGDILVGFNGQQIQDHNELFVAMSGPAVGSAVPLEVLRGGKLVTIEVTLREHKRSRISARPQGKHSPHHAGKSPHHGRSPGGRRPRRV